MALRNIIVIDEEKCNGCGLCASACAEGAIKIINGKAKLVSETYCDGLGACIGHCPQDAIRIIQREAKPFDEEATKAADTVYVSRYGTCAIAKHCRKIRFGVW
jgi:ferredoxin